MEGQIYDRMRHSNASMLTIEIMLKVRGTAKRGCVMCREEKSSEAQLLSNPETEELCIIHDPYIRQRDAKVPLRAQPYPYPYVMVLEVGFERLKSSIFQSLRKQSVKSVGTFPSKLF